MLETIYYISQTVAVVAILASLVFVGVQIRQNTRALKATSHHAITDSFNHLNTTVASDQAVAQTLTKAYGGLSGLEPSELFAFHSMMIAYIRVFETLYFQSQNGTMPMDLWDVEKRPLAALFISKGVQEWWANPDLPFSDAFRAEVSALRGETAQVQPEEPGA